ncbi:MAG: heavy metal translocating P-type ATPase [Actinomycetota bacterium]|nr:heavy metal translocating P-type ATPase [Actinomycetota bacterium]
MLSDSKKAARTIEETYILSGLDCPDCAMKVEKAIQKMPGVKDVSVNFAASNIHIKYDPRSSSTADIFSKIRGFGYEVGSPEDVRRSVFRIKGLDCPDCAMKLQKKIAGLSGVVSAELVYETAKLTVNHHEEVISLPNLKKAVSASGYRAEFEDIQKTKPSTRPFWISNKRSLTVIASAIPLAAGGLVEFIAGQSFISITLLSVAILIAGYRPAKSSIFSLKSLVFDMNVLMTLAVIGAIAIGQWIEAATVMFLYSLGTMLEAYTMDKTRHAIHRLLEIAPNEATVKHGHDFKVLPVEDICIGDIVIVRPGERIPVDGEVIFGQSSVNQSPITGESLPVLKNPGEQVFAGTLNLDGYLEIKTSKLYKDTTLSHIIHLVEDAQAKKASSQRFIDRFSRYYTPAVICAAFLIAIFPPLFGQPFATWFYRALVLLVISCPCALVISTPVSITSAIGAASRNGILIKGGAYLEAVGNLSAVVFDKTGTLTSGRLSVTDVIPLNGYSDADVIKITASIEQKSGHPLSDAIVDYAKDIGTEFAAVHNFKSLPGLGLQADIDGITYYVGNQRLFQNNNLADPEVDPLIFALQREGKTTFLVGTNEKLLGIVAVADKLREGARETINRLNNMGISNIVMLTGDNADTAKEIASQVGIRDYRADLLPKDKVDAIEEIISQYGPVAMIGDGVNDAPAISRANVGIAMGAIGSDIALETSDIALMSDDLKNVPYIIQLSRRALKIIKQNVAASIIVKFAFIALAVFGFATLWMAVFADTGISVLVILNGMRLFARSGS